MGIFVSTNVSSLRGRNYLSNVNKSLDTTYQRLSSGLRINSAKDDAAGLQISDRLTTQINGLNQANRNANDGIALLQIMDGASEELVNILQRMRTLAVQSANGINTQEDRDALQAEVEQLYFQYEDIVNDTKYGGKRILSGYDNKIPSYSIYSGYLHDLGSGNGDGGLLTLQIGANSGDSITLEVESLQWDHVKKYSGASTTGSQVTAIESCYIGTQKDAQDFLYGVDKIIGYIDKQRSYFGAMQNRLESSIRVQANVSTNTADARSRIRDTDFAEESANLSQQSIIQQAATSMLMQSNARPQIGLSLLG